MADKQYTSPVNTKQGTRSISSPSASTVTLRRSAGRPSYARPKCWRLSARYDDDTDSRRSPVLQGGCAPAVSRPITARQHSRRKGWKSSCPSDRVRACAGVRRDEDRGRYEIVGSVFGGHRGRGKRR